MKIGEDVQAAQFDLKVDYDDDFDFRPGFATRTQEVDSTNWKEIKSQRKCLSSVAGPENKKQQYVYL